MRAIQEQVRLPLRMAVAVVAQGIRIRFGRSLITISGVALGIAFLMAILTSQALQRGVSAEDEIRADVQRMRNLLLSEIGPARGRTLGLVIASAPNECELRLLERLNAEGLAGITYTALYAAAVSPRLERLQPQPVRLVEVGRDASAVVVLGDAAPHDINWNVVLAPARQRVLALARAGMTVTAPSDVHVAPLSLVPDAATRARQAADLRRERFRNAWIAIIALLVTVMGISNAMLMSVTERFREIGTMKCLGALRSFVQLMFLIESGFMGLVGGMLGCLAGGAFCLSAYLIMYGWAQSMAALLGGLPALAGAAGAALAAGLVLAVVAALYPARVAARMVPADALRSNV
jgi:ABC-type antimicrobial peptide transport system permease subunit